jgi:hypothetical protein
MRRKWVCRQVDGEFKMIELCDYVPEGAKSAYIHQDTMDATWHPVNGQFYDSKSKFREVTRASGRTEIGNDYCNSRGEVSVNPQPYKTESVRETLIKAYKGELPRER